METEIIKEVEHVVPVDKERTFTQGHRGSYFPFMR
jgi:hypothetical protein